MSTKSVLLLTGQNNHDWRRSTPFVQQLLEASGLFEVTRAPEPQEALLDGPSLERFDLIFSDYNGPAWSTQAQSNFERAIKGGAGLVVLHAADNAFAGWTEYEKMVGLLWREGTGHGWYHAFKVHLLDREHPITAGLEDFEITDELYHRLVHMHGAPCHVLATAFSDPAKGGTGHDEPVMTAGQYGLGRVFHMILGHVWQDGPMTTFENVPFQRLLVRGCDWAARKGSQP